MKGLGNAKIYGNKGRVTVMELWDITYWTPISLVFGGRDMVMHWAHWTHWTHWAH